MRVYVLHFRVLTYLRQPPCLCLCLLPTQHCYSHLCLAAHPHCLLRPQPAHTCTRGDTETIMHGHMRSTSHQVYCEYMVVYGCASVMRSFCPCPTRRANALQHTTAQSPLHMQLDVPVEQVQVHGHPTGACVWAWGEGVGPCLRNAAHHAACAVQQITNTCMHRAWCKRPQSTRTKHAAQSMQDTIRRTLLHGCKNHHPWHITSVMVAHHLCIAHTALQES